MKRNWLWMLAGGLAACGGTHVDLAVPVTHQHDAAFRRQVELLQAGQVTLAAQPAGPGGNPAAMLRLEVLDVRSQPAPPDTLQQRVRKLAHLVALDLADPAKYTKYQLMQVQVTTHKEFFRPDADLQFSVFYPLASLR